MHHPNQTLCHCLNVQASDVRYLVEDLGMEDPQQVRACSGAGTGCMACRKRIAAYVQHLAEQRSAATTLTPAG